MEKLRETRPSRDVILAFFDAEDLGDIDGHPFSIGAEHLASHPVPGIPAVSHAVILDMVGGTDMILDVDAHILLHAGSRELTNAIFSRAGELGAEPFTRDKPQKMKYIVSDQWAFLRRGIPACLLIDIDYPPWHTHGDQEGAMSGRSLRIIEETLWSFLGLPPG